ncbi:leucyl/phenylalanyl-tRNA--protein transferase [Ilumatobacter coccineus]|uniref:Leucyl/phenylalanyl-tRNA--protein transferase n=1 Tax=Ilumatobacter coccineus (strain NBRC 103263 / KCTC 29153 / YM16-304) TaxID=1313172 RepID=A0A6C7EBK8_ILUCY|nr:leucyl/phenylalanyl-tRNA--protein transferase [Ilumatobacter coccineus]BAN04127.1 leucyl/phenylalanyl-tRNA--protein transferase [Ilumatobacter coccineus YM16-304]
MMPSPAEAEPGNDLVAIGADLEPGTLLRAYATGLFPMPIDPGKRRSKIAWYSPDPRGIIPLDQLRVSKSLRRSMRRYEVRLDTAFAEVVAACADPTRDGRWITHEIEAAYCRLHELGWAHSVEVYDDEQLVGGLYGVRYNGLFAGESMFHQATDASKVALVWLVDWMRSTDGTLLDVQWLTPHLESLGAIAVPRSEYLRLLDDAI